MSLRTALARGLKSTVVGLLCLSCLPVRSAEDSAPAAVTPTMQADEYVRTALKFEVEGDENFRQLTLELALQTAAEHPGARWHSGYVQVDGKWLTIEEAEAKWADDSRLSEYRAMRARQGASAEADVTLARWCDKQRLGDQARYHWSRVYRALPGFREEATRRLNLKPFAFRGQTIWAMEEEMAQHQRAASRALEAHQQYLPICMELRKQLQSGSPKLRQAALKRLADITDPLAIPAIETMISTAGEPLTSTVIYHLEKMPEHQATMSLVRHAVFAPLDDGEWQNSSRWAIASTPHQVRSLWMLWNPLRQHRRTTWSSRISTPILSASSVCWCTTIYSVSLRWLSSLA